MNKTGYPSLDKTHLQNEKFLDIHPIIPSMSIYNALKLISSFYKKEKAIDCLNLEVSFEELIQESDLISKGLKELGVRPNDIVSVAMPNFYQAVVIYLACNRIGAVTTFLNSASSMEEVSHYLNLFESPVFVNYNKNFEYNKKIKNTTKVQQIITLYPEELNQRDIQLTKKTLTGYSDYITYKGMKVISSYCKPTFKTWYNGSQNALILFTSGTTGNPKSVVLTNKNILSSGIYMKNSTHLTNTKGEKSLVCVPFTYPYGFATSTLMSLLCGREAILCPDLTKDNISYYLKKNPNIIFGSPALLELIKRNITPDLDLSSVHTFISGGDFLTNKQTQNGQEFFRQHHSTVQICNGSGNAETVGASTNSVGIPSKPETVGKVLVGTNAMIINEETGKELKYGKEGLLCISGQHIFKEYYKEPQLTKEAKFNYNGKTYFKTGTRGFLDEEGYFTLTGRDSRYYIISTLNKIYCDHVQNIISLIDEIEEVAVVKKPDDDMLYSGKAYIVLKKGLLPTKEMKEYIQTKCSYPLYNSLGEMVQLKPYEIPSSIDFVEHLPRNKADKLDYTKLEQQAKAEYEAKKKQGVHKKIRQKKEN